MTLNPDNLYYAYNGQGDVSFLTDSTGTVVADYVFDAYGNQSKENIVYNPFGYRGEYTDDESGLIYLRARMYDAETGRFINEDPVKEGLNWYVYCGNNPVIFIDPFGLAPSVMDAALMAEHVYLHNWDESIINRRVYDRDGTYTGWRMIDMFTQGTSKIGVYVRGDGKDSKSNYSGKQEYVLSFKGTKPTSGEDWENNAQQLLGKYSEHLTEGLEYSKWFVNNFKDYEITFTGHSKGGGEAAVSAEFWNRKAIIFNPSIPNITWPLADQGYVHPFVVKSEILNYLLGEIPLGTTKYLEQQHNGWLPGTTILDRINNHSMEAVISGLREGGY